MFKLPSKPSSLVGGLEWDAGVSAPTPTRVSGGGVDSDGAWSSWSLGEIVVPEGEGGLLGGEGVARSEAVVSEGEKEVASGGGGLSGGEGAGPEGREKLSDEGELVWKLDRRQFCAGC